MKIISALFLSCFALHAVAKSPNLVTAAIDDPQFSTLVAALKAADLVDTVKNGTFTVLAPTNEAFDKLPKEVLADLLKPENKDRLVGVLTYHAIPGRIRLEQLLSGKTFDTAQGQVVNVAFREGRIRLNDAAMLQKADLLCENGIIHVIDSVLIPPTKKPAGLAAVAASDGRFHSLISAVKAAGLLEALEEGEFTVFAPTDAAFAALPKETLQALLTTEEGNRTLVSVLKNHLVAGSVSAGDALNARGVSMAGGQVVDVTYADGGLKIGAARILNVDVQAANGVIHVIDRVLLPTSEHVKAGTASKSCDLAVASCGSPCDSDRAATAMASGSTIIEQAISAGVPMFNRGDHAGCADLYREVSVKLMGVDGMPEPIVQGLDAMVKKASRESSSTTKAWMLRAGLDQSYRAVKVMEASAASPTKLQPTSMNADGAMQKISGDTTVLTDFSEQGLAQRWKTVNDNVMGGRSSGGPTFAAGALEFSGSTNTDGGGFSSIRTLPQDWNISEEADGIVARIKGDGRTYQFDLRKKGVSSWTAYRVEFPTEKTWSWREVRIPFSAFKPTRMGQPVRGAGIEGPDVESIGLFIYDKKDGPFKLQVDWIGTYQENAGSSTPL